MFMEKNFIRILILKQPKEIIEIHKLRENWVTISQILHKFLISYMDQMQYLNRFKVVGELGTENIMRLIDSC